MNDNKDFLKSKTTWGAFFMSAQPILAGFGVDINPGDAASVTATIFGVMLFFVGQFGRKKRITSFAGIGVKW